MTIGMVAEGAHDIVDLVELKGTELLLSGYSTKGETIRKWCGEKEYEIEQYQGVHANEYCVYEMNNGVRDGTAELFEDGIVKLRWTMKRGVRDGSYVLFDKGVAVKQGQWNDIDSTEETVLENRRNQVTMVIRFNGVMVYEGDFNDTMQRNGLGFEYEDGLLKRFGLWENNVFVELRQRFISENEMIEYEEGSTSDLLSRKPVFIGGYQLDVASGLMKRNGWGHVLDKETGVCVCESEWEMGVEKVQSRIVLYDGWYNKHDSGKSTRTVLNDGMHPVVIPPTLLPVPLKATELTINAPQFDFMDIPTLQISNLPLLRSIIIEDNCFTETRSITISNLSSLEKIRIGEKCFTLCQTHNDIKNSNQKDGICRICDCCNLKSVSFGALSFGDYSMMILRHLSSLRSLTIGMSGFYNAPLFSLSCSHKGLL